MKREPFCLEDFGADLCALARGGKLDPLIGREAVLRRMEHVLARKTKRNPLLLGHPGVGKSAIVEGLAQRIVAGRVPAHLRGMTVFSLQIGSLVAGTAFRGEFEKRLRLLAEELCREDSRRILFIDEIHLLDRAGKSEGGLDAANLLKPLLARGALACIGATTDGEWEQMLLREPALERRFMPVLVPEVSSSEALAILRGLRPKLEKHHGITIADEALEFAIDASRERSGRLPDKALDLLDEACAALGQSAGPGHSPRFDEALAEARQRFDLETYAQLRSQERSACVEERLPVLDRSAFSLIGLDARSACPA